MPFSFPDTSPDGPPPGPSETVRSARKKASYIGVPKVYALELAMRTVIDAFGWNHGCYVVGSSLDRPDWRDVDVVMMMSDAAFRRLFPDANLHGQWEFDARWLLMTIAISQWLSQQTGLPIDFKFQPTNWANEHHKGHRNPVGLRYVPNGAPMPLWEES